MAPINIARNVTTVLAFPKTCFVSSSCFSHSRGSYISFYSRQPDAMHCAIRLSSCVSVLIKAVYRTCIEPLAFGGVLFSFS